MKQNGYPYLTDTSMDDGCSIWPACGCIDERCDGEPVRSSTAVRVVLHVLCWGAGIAGIAALGMAVLAATNAKAHEAPSGWRYPLSCCSNRDCGTVPATRVKEGPSGYEVTLLPGDHDFITAKTGPRSYVIPYAETKDSPDGLYHICLLPTSLKQLCFFAGARMG
ncbi:hypothetical protein ACFFTN_01250 [Aminobacter aganoensis]|uniref:Uncharacterized protein n=1 Tax=Aminobacter aganoensis TaxID=83264 RepID=A0A7X0F5T2_9HYPH|nr:hypothetical protein [Aminobacter aganoensis]MBB6353515.1 hypothetical protein [Aminobacter aganoensis]